MTMNQCLSLVIKPGIRVESRSIDEYSSDDQRPVDEFFTVHLAYYKYGWVRGHSGLFVTGTLKLKRESSDWQFDVMGWLAELNVNVSAWDTTIDVVVESCESLITDVRESGRTSLVFKLMVYQNVEEEDYEPMHPDNTYCIEQDYEPVYCDTNRIKSILQDGGVKFANSSHSGTISNCSICLEEFGMSNNVATLPCSHIYHEKCMIRWVIQGKRTCPLCRLEINLNWIMS